MLSFDSTITSITQHQEIRFVFKYKKRTTQQTETNKEKKRRETQQNAPPANPDPTRAAALPNHPAPSPRAVLLLLLDSHATDPGALLVATSAAAETADSQCKRTTPSGKFYSTFGRPIFKTILIAILTYQFAYYAWIRLEHNELKADMNATILNLEARIVQLEREQQP
ncbi:hypothetical protein F4775DRAFT_208131 [Biscogniauxia sp. FL1348]|nr:hypothetical protein F4775DRAFT_208131 [Biscogniauxia sp. FL1348]